MDRIMDRTSDLEACLAAQQLSTEEVEGNQPTFCKPASLQYVH